MRFTLSSSLLSSRLADMAKVLSPKNSLAVLKNFLFEVQGLKLTITASDSENVMTSTIDLISSEGDGSFCIDSQTILDIVKDVPEQPVEIAIDMDTMAAEMHYLNGLFNFMAAPADQYPTFSELEGDVTTISLSAAILSKDINLALFATATEELRPVMNGVYFDLTPDALVVVATDGHKLVRCKNMSVKTEMPVSFILPKKPAGLLKNMLSKDGGDVIIRYSERAAEITFDEGTISCRLIEGRYPNYNSVIPQNNPNQLSIDRAAFLSAMKRVMTSASGNALVRVHVENGLMKLQAEDVDKSKRAEESINCDYNGTSMNIGFRGTTLIEILSTMDCEQVTMLFADPSRPGIIVPAEQEENEDLLMLIMPMLLND